MLSETCYGRVAWWEIGRHTVATAGNAGKNYLDAAGSEGCIQPVDVGGFEGECVGARRHGNGRA